ncbi:MAG: hypothetical protein JSS87_11605 [Acidobacteria bacterium]|nr:hypothetical protein [Acidobacteriota bacterium]
MKLPKHAELWLPAYCKDRLLHMLTPRRAKRIWVAITDHYEPMGGGVSLEVGQARVAAWQRRWPEIVEIAPSDAAGNKPRYTCFYPQEEYRREILTALEPMAREGLIDVEVHIHHEHDTPESFAQKINEFCRRLHDEHGFLRHRDGKLIFGFIHGNWALDNSRPDGLWCGVTGELKLLRDLGCYADFTMPSLPSATQGKVINQIYWTNGDPKKPKGFDCGTKASPGGGRQGDLLMITGPLGLRYRDRWMPRLETGELAVYDPATPYRVQRWMDLAPQLGEDIFLKLYAHGAREDNAGGLLGSKRGEGSLEPMFRWIAEAAEQRGLELHWATAYEMFSAVDRLISDASQEHAI